MQTQEQLMARIKELEGQLSGTRSEEVTVKIGNKRNVVVGNLGQRFPVTLYAPSWVQLLTDANRQKVLDFIEDHRDELSWGKE